MHYHLPVDNQRLMDNLLGPTESSVLKITNHVISPPEVDGGQITDSSRALSRPLTKENPIYINM